MALFAIFFLVAIHCYQALAGIIPNQLGQPVNTTSGLVTGTVGRYAQNISAYLGVPYAHPPVGERRWLAPQKLISSKAVQATGFSPDCPGTLPLGQDGFFFQPRWSEDCLTLNVWAPPFKTGDSLKAVLVFIYGGAFVGGSAGMAMSDGSVLAATQDIIVVAMNYRLAVLGFPGAPGLEDQNLGLMDQRLAVEWVRDNIKQFGGDPSRIVISGESAGADSVDIWSFAYTKDPIVKGFIGQSGAATMCGLITNSSRQSWPKLATSLNCTEASTQMACMRTKSAQQIITEAGKIGSAFPPAFVPMPDGKIVFDDYTARAERGDFIKAPFLIGNNDKELGILTTFADAEFTCPAAHIAGTRRKAGINSWRYRFYGGGDPAVQAKGALAGLPNPAMHAAEVFYVFGTLGTMGLMGQLMSNDPTPQKLAVANEMQTVWAAFAKDPDNGPTKLGWPLYNAKGISAVLNISRWLMTPENTLVRLMYKNETAHSLTRGDEFDGNCSNIDCKRPGFGKSTTGLGALSGLFGGLGKGKGKATFAYEQRPDILE